MAMREKEKDVREFFDVMGKVADYYNRDVTKEVFKTYFEMLCDFDIEDVKQALRDHMRDSTEGRFFPTIAHVVGKLEKNKPKPKGHIGVDEAWSIAMQAEDEYSTVVWTQPIAEAWGIAKNVLPDRTGARMAFKSAYERILSGLPANAALKWYPSIGIDAARREDALNEAVKMGRLSGEHAAGLLPPPKTEQNKEVAAKYLAQLRLMIGKQ